MYQQYNDGIGKEAKEVERARGALLYAPND